MRFALTFLAAMATAAPTLAADPPRRLLVVQIAEYVYLAPLTHATLTGPERARDSAERLAAGLGVPTSKDNDQLFLLADTAGPDAPLPTKEILTGALDRFCTTTRAQDRIVIYLGVHAVERDGKAYVVPIDGDPAKLDSLLPLGELYARLKGLKAAQKVVVWDVCRHNPERFITRRAPGPMTPALFKSLTDAPEGMEVIVSCSSGERALEYFTPRGPASLYAGSAYLDAIAKAAADLRQAKKSAAGDSIAVKDIHTAAARFVALAAKAFGATQTPALVGSPPASPAEYDPKEAPAKRFNLPTLPGASATAKAIFEELALPPLVGNSAAPFSRLPFRSESLKGYEADATTDEIFKEPEKYPLRVATLRALTAIRNGWPLNKRDRLFANLTAPVTDAAKRAANREQEGIALALTRLEVELENLTQVAGMREKETKRWQANYDFTYAQLRLRLVMLEEYNRAMANVKTESLPDLPGGATGWRFVSSTKARGGRSVRRMLADAQQSFTKLAADHKGTPWEALAFRSLATLPSATWEAVVPPKSDK